MKELKRRAKDDTVLTTPQKMHLTFGRSLLGGNPFRDGEHRRAVWERYGAGIIKDYILMAPGKRPFAWWEFEAPEPRDDNETSAAYLGRLGLLSEHEAGRLTESAFTPVNAFPGVEDMG